MKLVKIDASIPRDIRYATVHNFTHQKVYSVAECYLENVVAQALAQAQREFNSLGLSLKVFDGYRPLSVQRIFWNLFPDERYVADPKKGSRHNRGCAVDLTLIDLATGNELPMGTDFDDFTERAHRDCTDLAPQVLENRQKLEDIMRKHSFTGLPTEWWHFDFNGWEAYPIRDVSFEELGETN